MRHITLLGDATMPARPLRPDRVYKTGVLSPMVGFRPGQAVMATADAFTTGPQTGMTLGGPASGFFAKVSAWWQGVKARAVAGKGAPVATATMPVAANDPQIHTPGGAMPPIGPGRMMTANAVAPYMTGIPGGMVASAWGQSSSLPTNAADAASKAAMLRWRGLRSPWG